MEAQLVHELPLGRWQYEPKWDGFRCLAYRQGGAIRLYSKSGQDLTRYFPEVAAVLDGLRSREFVLDGELIVPFGGAASFEQLLMRVHPAESRVRRLSNEHPALYVLFDLLAEGGRSYTGLPLAQRRDSLEAFVLGQRAGKGWAISPVTMDPRVASAWLQGATGIDGVIAKNLDAPYRPGERAMQKVKRYRSADCVVGGFRYSERSTGARPEVGSLLLGLYDQAGQLDHVGFTSAIAGPERARLASLLRELVAPPGFTGRAPGGPSRWSTRRSMEWQPLRPWLVCEVRYDHFSEGRFRHGTRFLRWRPDKEPRQCTFEQVSRPMDSSLSLLRGRGAA